jgi:glyoxylase-like metal-dependent hydrolase (beta-lactamase superfamily II)
MEPEVHPFYEPKSCSWQYIVVCPGTKEAVIIDPVLDFDLTGFAITSQSADVLIDYILKNGYTVKRLLETHAHGDHLSASYYIQQTLWSRGHPHAAICISENIKVVQSHFSHKYHIPRQEIDHAFDHLFQPDEIFNIGDVTCTALHLPGHTPDHGGYKIGSNVFTGDSMFNPTIGSGRCDFPGGDSRELYRSMKRLLAFPPETKLYTGHDYPPSNKGPMSYVTVGEQIKTNKHVKESSTEDEFVMWRDRTDKALPEQRLVHQAMQVNVRGGKLASKSHDGKGYMLYLIDVPKVMLSG